MGDARLTARLLEMTGMCTASWGQRAWRLKSCSGWGCRRNECCVRLHGLAISIASSARRACKLRNYWICKPADFTTVAHFFASMAITARNSSGVLDNGSAPSLASASRKSG